MDGDNESGIKLPDPVEHLPLRSFLNRDLKPCKVNKMGKQMGKNTKAYQENFQGLLQRDEAIDTMAVNLSRKPTAKFGALYQTDQMISFTTKNQYIGIYGREEASHAPGEGRLLGLDERCRLAEQ